MLDEPYKFQGYIVVIRFLFYNFAECINNNIIIK